jgi:cell wall-associated NlpC family hydrolase
VLHGRAQKVRRVAVGASLSALAITMGVQSVSYAEPTIAEVEDKVGKLYHEAEIAQERLNDVRHKMGAKQRRLVALERGMEAREAAVERIGDIVASTVAEQAQSSSIGPTAQLLLSDDPDDFLDGLAATEAFSRHQGEMIAQLETASERLALREKRVKAQLADLADDKAQIAEENETVEAKLAEAKELLAELEAEERERLRIEHAAEQAEQAEQAAASRATESPRPPVSTAPASGSAAAAVDFAMAQVGDSYVYGAAGPSSWDCSGLTMGAWGAAGVGLPHSSSAQMGSGTPVSQSELQPGDLVFYYSPVSHVGMYIGNGQIVHAANPSTGVQVTSLDSMPYSGAVRPG